MQDQVEGGAAALGHDVLDARAALRLGDVLLDGEGAADGGNGDEIDAEYEAADRNSLDGDLHPAARGSAEVEDGVGGAEKGELGVELDQLP